MMRARLLLVLTVSAALICANPAGARPRHSGPAPGRFDYYLLSLSLAPSFCMLSPTHQASPECHRLTPEAFRQTPLTVHGLWPNLAGASVNEEPHDCAAPPFRISDALERQLARYMPGGPGLAEHEWRKHGTCSGLPPEAYFSRIVSLAQHANDVIGGAMRDGNMLGNTLRISDLLRAVAAREPALAAAIVVDCRIPRGGGDALVEEIRVALSKDFAPRPVTQLGLGQNSGCPRGAGRVPEPVPTH